MRRATYTDPDGRRWTVLLPQAAPDSEAPLGVPVGPAPLDELRLPLDVEVRLHNELHDRGILTEKDARRRPADLSAAIAASLKLSVQAIQNCYAGLTREGAAP